MYKLVYIKGISRYDTWKFTDKNEQYDYFDNLNGVIINDYYPPHYTNTIKLELSQVDYNEVNYNYLLLSFNNKYYCYFIDSIEYINEDVYSINITMDTIQTYMFDMNFLQSNVIRRTIDRFIYDDDDNLIINRNYNRENLSKGYFRLNYQTTSESDLRFILIYTSTDLDGETGFVPVAQNSTVDGKYNYSMSGYYLYVLPIITKEEDFYKTYTINLNGTDTNYWYQAFPNTIIEFFSTMPGCINMIMCNDISLNNLFDITYTIDNTNRKILFNSSILTSETGSYGEGITSRTAYRVPGDIVNNITQKVINTNFTINRRTGVSKFYNFVPQLLDENYIKLFFGEKSNYNQIPLSQITNQFYIDNTLKFKINSFFDLLSCDRTYWFNTSNTNYTKDDFNTIIVCNSNEGMILKNDAWKNYISQNKATWTSGYQLQKDMNQLQMNLGLSNTFSTSLVSVLGGISTGSPSKVLGGVSSFVGGQNSAIGSWWLRDIKLDADRRILKENLLAVPQESKQGNNYSNDIMLGLNKFIIRMENVSDLTEVAEEYENYGYSVNELYYNTNILDINNRYYYNIVCAKDLKFDLLVLSTNDIKDDIRNRFEVGLRLWNKSHNTNILDNIIYDNVETNLMEE